ncbi:cytochrome P450 [Pyrrhoderma noxium]|uniref:Cytochrome P450 n=1 Tax=Pyrrhoderma noxium TaxID=2282107 RepID=A0A286U7R2_9AGAM|nr:cytochrome P450 [Pyrrhoderma noxium]
MSLIYVLDLTAVSCLLLVLGYRKYLSRKRLAGVPYPPGPKGLPIIGNVLDLPETNPWITVQGWSKEYGPLVFIENFGKPYLFLNSYQSMVDLLDKRGHIYSSRPENAALNLEGWDAWFITTFPYGDEHRRSRQHLHRFLQISKVEDYFDIQTQATHKLLEGLLNYPDEFFRLIRTWAGRIILKIAYGHDVADKNDPLVDIAEKGLDAFHVAEGVFFLNAFPWLRLFPKYRKLLEEGRKAARDMHSVPYEFSRKNFLDGTAIPSISSKLMAANSNQDGTISDERLISNVTGVIYAGGSHTTVATLLTTILALLLHPDVQKRAQEELDRVVGKNNLPTMKDRPNLPYIDAIFRECFRWQAVTPLGVAHTATEDDEYMGYRIPAGTTIFANIWAVLRDPQLYPDPDKFIPERWLPSSSKESPMNSNKIGFGFGRRLCPGRHFAENSVFIGVSSILSMFNIEKALGEDGKPITPEVDYVSDFVRQPKPFKCVFKPRSAGIPALISQAIESAK